MKIRKVFWYFSIAICLPYLAKSQTTDFELGVRLGFVTSVDMVLPIKSNRIHSNIGWGIDYYLFDNIYDFQFPIPNTKWMIYAGAGVGIRYWNKDAIRSDKNTTFKRTGIAGVGEIGLEYHFDGPLSLGLDWSPFYDMVQNKFNNYGTVSVRYRF